MTEGMLFSPQFEQERWHLRKNGFCATHFGMAARTKRNHKMEHGFPRYTVMNDNRTFASPRSSANTAAVAVSLEDLLSQTAKIFFVLPFQGVTSRTKSERKDLLASASAMQRPLYSGFRGISFQGLTVQR
jgi:hypothetical protein